MKGDRLTRRGFLSKLTNWIPRSIFAIVPLAWIGRSKPYHFQEVAPEKSDSAVLLAKKGCACTCEKKDLRGAAKGSAASGSGTGCGCNCGSGPKNEGWITLARSMHRDIK